VRVVLGKYSRRYWQYANSPLTTALRQALGTFRCTPIAIHYDNSWQLASTSTLAGLLFDWKEPDDVRLRTGDTSRLSKLMMRGPAVGNGTAAVAAALCRKRKAAAKTEGLYGNSIGALTMRIRRPKHTSEDEFALNVADDYTPLRATDSVVRLFVFG
jgi:hypothetical protein